MIQTTSPYTIELGDGYQATVDPIDYFWLSLFTCEVEIIHGKPYVYRMVKGDSKPHSLEKFYLHDEISVALKGETVEFVNGDTLDLQRFNLKKVYTGKVVNPVVQWPKEKVCKSCGIPKPRDEFSDHPDMKDGKYNQCKQCKCEYSRAYYAKKSKQKLEAVGV